MSTRKRNKRVWRDVIRRTFTKESLSEAAKLQAEAVTLEGPEAEAKMQDAADALEEIKRDPPIRAQLERYYTAPREERWEAYMRVIQTIPHASQDTLRKIRKQLRLEKGIET
jgi:hypothetical protein